MGLELVKRETCIKHHACSCPFVSIIQLRVSVELWDGDEYRERESWIMMFWNCLWHLFWNTMKVWWHMPQPNWSLWHLFGTVDLLRQTLWEVPACGCHVVRVNLRVTCPDLSTENCLLMIVHDKFITCFFLECPRRSLIICVMSTIVLLLFC
jgi:hypothetical protein